MKFKKHLLPGCLALLILLLIIGVMTNNSFMLTMDQFLNRFFYDRPQALAPSVVRVVTQLGNSKIELVLAFLFAAFLFWRKRQRLALWFFGTNAIGMIALIVLGKLLFHRPRPSVLPHLAHASGFSFPSGHALSAIIFYGSIIFLILTEEKPPKALARTLIVLGVLLCVLVGWSRLFLGVHYYTDILAGFSIGSLWLYTLCQYYPQPK